MLHQPTNFSEPIPSTIKLQMLLAAGGGMFAAVQALLIVLQGDILCLNDGCEVVEQLTRVPPIVFNVAGSVYFLSVFLLFWRVSHGGRGKLTMARILLLAGMAAEGVLIGFQYFVAGAFCSYCLSIFAIIFLLNLLMGWQQFIGGLAVTVSVLLAFASLQFSSDSRSERLTLEHGTYGYLDRQQSAPDLHLFFSSTCPHCEDVIATIDDTFSCNLNFNPIDAQSVSPLASLVVKPDYSTTSNRKFLQTLGVTEIPVLVVRSTEELRVLKGKKLILQYFDENCRPRPSSHEETSDFSGMTNHGSALPFLPPNSGDETCTVGNVCDDEPAAGNIK